MSRPNYRVVLSFDSERKLFTARIPELPQCSGEGATRSEAITRVEEELDAVLHSFGERGARPPSALDDADRGLSGELAIKVSIGLHRELLWQAHNEGVDLGQLAAELLAAALEQRRHAGRGGRRHGGNDNIGNTIHHEGPRGRGEFAERGRGGHAARFHDMLEDRAAFVDYVRKLESDGGRPRGDSRAPGEGRPRGESRPYGEGRGHGPQGGHGEHARNEQGRGGPGRERRPGREGHRGGNQRRGPEGRDNPERREGREGPPAAGPGPAAPKHSPSESES